MGNIMRDSWSVGARSLVQKLNHGMYQTDQEIDSNINERIAELEKLRTEMKFVLSQQRNCAHEWTTPSFTIQKRIFGQFVRVNQMSCNICGKLEVYQEKEDGSDRPEWAIEATERYFNNFI